MFINWSNSFLVQKDVQCPLKVDINQSTADGFHTKSIIAEIRIQPIIWFSSFGVWSSENFTFIYKSWIIIFVFVQWNNGLHQKKTRQWTKEQKLARLKILEETLANAAKNALALLLWPMPAFSIFTDVFASKSLVGFILALPFIMMSEQILQLKFLPSEAEWNNGEEHYKHNPDRFSVHLQME